jgi:antitoxin (DNA-binding transcriptional repressor) of toxin-antitoxin stability system
MRAVGLKVLKNKLSEYIRMVASGETILVTDRERVVAEIVPPRDRQGAYRKIFLEDAVRNGWLTPATLHEQEPPPRLPIAPLRDILRELESERDDR